MKEALWTIRDFISGGGNPSRVSLGIVYPDDVRDILKEVEKGSHDYYTEIYRGTIDQVRRLVFIRDCVPEDPDGIRDEILSKMERLK